MKLRLPHKFQAALMAALASVSFTTLSTGTLGVATGAALLAGQQAQAGSIDQHNTLNLDDNTTYNGYIYNFVPADANATTQFHNGTRYQYVQNGDHMEQTETTTVWQSFANNQNPTYGHTLRLTDNVSGKTVNTDFSPLSLGGLIVEEGTYTLGRANTATDFNGFGNVNLNIMGDFTLLSRGVDKAVNSGVRFDKGGEWRIAEGKTLKFDTATYAVTIRPNLTVNVTGGGTLDLSSTAKFVLGAGTHFNVASGTTVTMSNVLETQGTAYYSGNLTLPATLNISGGIGGYEVYEAAASDFDGTDDYAGSGYRTGNATKYYIVKGGEGSTLSGSPTTVTGGGNATIVDGKSLVATIALAGEDTTYYVNSDLTYNEEVMGGASGFSIAKGTVLSAGSTTSFSSAKVLHGTGTYALADTATALTGSLTLGDDWTGTVRLTNASATSLNFGNLVNGTQSTLEFNGFKGYSSAWNGTNVQNIKLTTPDGGGVAWNATDAATQKDNNTATYSGTWSGDGTMTIAPNKLNYTFTGDISQWTGKLQTVSTYNNTFNLTFTGNAQAINAEIAGQHNTNKMNLVVDTNATFSKNVTANTLTVNAGKTAKFNQTATFADGITADGGTVVLGSNVTATFGSNNYTSVANNFQAGFVVGEGAKLDLRLAKGDVKTLLGDITLQNGATLSKWDGGLKLTGALTLGEAATDEVHLAFDWAKSNIEMAGLLAGSGKAYLTNDSRDNNAEYYIISGADGTYDGEMIVGKSGADTVSDKTARLRVAGEGTALQKALVNLAGGNKSLMELGAANVTLGGLSGTAGSSVGLASGTASSTLTINGSGDYAGSIGAGISLAKAGTGTQTIALSGDTALGTVTVNEGTLKLGSSGTLSTGAVSVTGGTLELTSTVGLGTGSFTMDGGTLKLHGTNGLTSTSGSLAFNSGTLDLSGLQVVAGTDYTLASSTGGTVTLGGVNFSLSSPALKNQYELTVQGGNTLVLSYTQSSNELIWDNDSTSGKWNTTDGNWHVGTAGAGTSRFSEGDDVKFTTSPGGTVSLDGDITAGNITIEDGANISIQNNGHKLAGKLQGSGTYALASGVTALPVDLNVSDSGWTGTVKLTSVSGTAGNNINLNTYGHAGSKVEMDGVNGYFYQAQAIFEPELVLSGNGLTLINGFSTMPSGNPKPPTTYAFAGGVSGTGDMTFSKTDSTVTQNIYFTGDVGEWVGNLQVVQGFTVIAQFSGAADMVNAGISRTGGTLNLEVGNGTNDFSTTFKKSVVASTLTINEHASATFENLLSASTITGAGNLNITSTGTLKLAGPSTVSVGSLTLASGSFLDVSNITQMAGLTVNLASYTNSVTCTDANITGVNSSLTYTLNTADNNVTLTFASKPQPTPTPVADLGKVMYVGDSITDGVSNKTGVNAKSWRYSFFQVLADGGISQVEEGYYQHTQSSGAITTTTYGGRTFENIHSAKASARSWETAGVPTSQKGGDRYDYTSIQNWLGQRETKRNGQAYPADKPRYSGDDAPNTYFMLLGTNDLLSEGGDHIGESHFNSVLSSMFGYSGGSFDGQNGTFDIIWKSMTDERSDAKLIVLEMPTWSPNHGNHQNASDFAYLTKFNQKLHEWADSKANKAQITIVNPNPGIVDVANTTKPGSGVPTMFIDGLHPSAQGELLMAGNIAKQLGYAGRSVGLDRAAYTAGSTEWHTAGAEPITVVAGDPAQTIGTATGAFSARDGYTIDFSAVYGNGIVGGWSDAAGNALSIMVGDGSHTGTLTLSEAYVMWGDTVLYSRDNHVTGDNFRIAYVNASITPSDNVNTGYYVWMGDQLIGEALDATTGSSLLNGIQLSATGASSSVTGTVTGLTWADKAYAPTTKLYENTDTSKLFHLVQGYISTEPHDNSTPAHITGFDSETARKETSDTIGAGYFGAVSSGTATADTQVQYTLTRDSGNNAFGVVNASSNANVAMVFGGGGTVKTGTYSAAETAAFMGAYIGSISGKLSAEMNDITFAGNVIMGLVTNGTERTVGSTELIVNPGARIKGNVYGGHGIKAQGTITNGTHITVTGGTIEGSIYGGNEAGSSGSVAGGSEILITGGIITGDVNGGSAGGTFSGTSNVTIVGNLPYIQGNISADNVLLQGVSPNDEGYTDFFDAYRGTITGTETITLDNYTVDHLYAALVTKTLVLSHESITTIHNLTLTACTITANEGTSVTLADSLTLGNTANFSGDVSLAEEGITIDVSELMQDSPGDRITLFSGAEGSKLGGLSDLSLISVTGSGSEDYHLAVGNEGQYLYLDRNTAALIPWHEPSENVIRYQGLNQTASGNYVAGAHVEEIEGHTGTGVYTSVTSGTGVGALYANQGAHTGDVYMLVNGVTMTGPGAYGWIAAHYSNTLKGNASVKVENSGTSKAMLFGAVETDKNAATTVDGNVYVEVDAGTFATFTTRGAMASYAGSYQADITGEARLVTAGGTFENDVYGGVHTGAQNSIGSTKLDLRGGSFKGNVYGAGVTGSVTGDTNVIVSGTAVVDGSVYGGGTGGTVGGSTNVTISGDDAQVKGNVYGNTALAQGGTVTLKDRTNGFGDDSRVIVTEALNLQNTQGTVSSQITAETVHLTGNSTATINSLTLTPTSAADTCALTMDTGSALTLGGTLSLSDTATYTGALTLTDGMTLDLSRMQLTGYEEGPVTLLSSNNGALTYHDLTSYDLNLGHAEYESCSLSVDSGNNLVLTFTQPTPADSLIWDGTQNSNWSTNPDDQNWHAYEESPGTSAFTTDSKVTFNEGTSSVVLTEDISSGNIAVRDGANVTLHTDPQVARVLETPRLSVADGSTLTVDANVALTTGTITGSGTVSLRDGTKLVLTDGVDNNGTLNVGSGAIVKLAGTDMLAVQNLKFADVAVLDVSNIVIPAGAASVKIADIDGRLDFHSLRMGTSESSGHYVDLVTVANYQGGPTDVVYLKYEGTRHEGVGVYYFTDAELYLVKEATGLYWNNRDDNGNLIGGVWQPAQTDRGRAGIANWNAKLTSDTEQNPNVVAKTTTPLYFITETPDQEITILVDRAYEGSGELNNMQASTIVVGGGGTFNFVRKDSTGEYGINQNSNVPSFLIVRTDTTAHFEVDVKSGEYAQVLVETGARLDLFDATGSAGGPNMIYNQGLFNMSFPGWMYAQSILNEGTANIGRVWDEEGKVIIESTEQPFMLFAEEIYNEAGATMTLAAEYVAPMESSDTIVNEGELIFRTDDTLYDMGVNVSIPIEGMGAVTTVGTDAATFSSTVDGSMLNTGAKSTTFNKLVTITDTTTLTAEDFAEDEDKRSTTTFNSSSQLGEHVVMGANTTLDLTPGNSESADYTMGEVVSSDADQKDQEFIVRSGATADVAGNVSLPDGKAQIAGGGKLTIGGATSSVGELAATGGGTAVAVVELNGSNANEAPVLNAKKLSNENGTTLRVLNTDTENARTAQFNIGDEASASSSNYSGALQYGVGANAASGSGMELTIKDNNVAAGAVLEAYYDTKAPANAPVYVVVDTDAAKVVGLSDNINGPDADRSMSVSGSGENTAETGNNGLEITGNDDYEYAGKLGANLDIAYTGDGSQTIQGGVSNFNGAVTVDNGTTEEGVLAILNASSVSITDLTIGANDKLNVKQDDQGSQADGMTTVTGTLTARGGTGNASKLDGNLTMDDGSTLDVSAASGTGGLNLMGTLTINTGAQLSANDLLGVKDLGWFEMYDLAFGVTDMSSFGQVDWSVGVDATKVFANTGLKADEYYVRYSQGEMGGNGTNVGAVYIYRIPEPTTSTLSLLALAALAARRRRK